MIFKKSSLNTEVQNPSYSYLPSKKMIIEQSEKRREVTRQRGPNLVYYMLHIHIFRVLRNISAKEKVMKRRSRIQEKSSFDTIEKGEVIHKLSSPSPVLNPSPKS